MYHSYKGIIAALICIALWALIPVVSTLGQEHLDSHQFLFWSSLFSLLMVFLLCCKTNSVQKLRDYRLKDWGGAILLGFLGTYLYFLLLYKGYANGLSLSHKS